MTKTLTFPLTITPTGSLQAVEQDTPPDVASCVASILRTPQGWRIDDPDFGRPNGLLFQQGGVDPQQIADTLAEWEPRATGDIVTQTVTESGTQNVQINPTGRG